MNPRSLGEAEINVEQLSAFTGQGYREPARVAVDDIEPALRALLDRIEALLPPDRAVLAKALARAGYRLVPACHLAALDLDATATQLGRALDFLHRRLVGTANLRVEPTEGGTLVEVHVEDAPFLLATVKAELEHQGLEPVDVMHPVFGVRRDPAGRLTEILPARGAEHRETYLRLRLPLRLDPRRCAQVAERLLAMLADVRRVTRDYQRMKRQVTELLYHIRASAGSRYELTEVDEVIDLLDWLRKDRFVFLGSCEYDLAGGIVQPVPGSGLGLLTEEHVPDRSLALRQEREPERLLTVSRTTRLSTVYHRVPMVCVSVKKVAAGMITGEVRLLGLYAQKALAEPASAIPVLRRKLQRIIEEQDLVEHSHDERTVRTLFDSFPTHELFEADANHLRHAVIQLLEASRRGTPRVVLRDEPSRRSASALVAVPRRRFSEAVACQIRALLEQQLGATTAGHYRVTMTDQGMALLQFRLDGVTIPGTGREAELERQIVALIHTFQDALRNTLSQSRDPDEVRTLLADWGERLPTGYTDRTDVTTAIEDIDELKRLRGDGDVRMALRADRFRLYRAGPSVAPSRVLPLLESLGLEVLEEIPYRLDDTPLGQVHLHDYGVRARLSRQDGARVARAALAMWERLAEADSLNRLVLRAELEWEDVAVLRAYRRYRRQVGTSYTESYTNDALVEHPHVARALLGYVAARLAPDATEDETVARAKVEAALKGVERLDQDRILRGFLELVDATLRTNRWRRGTGPCSEALALKLDSHAVAGMPKPVPHVEVFVYSPDLEGVHLRGGPVARGGVRYSDRVEDFRTEVLDLMKAQIRKNTVIVPTGSKGGFVLKRGSGEDRAEVRRQYETFIRALLDVTDNVTAGTVVHPTGVRPRDGEDPYLVVAADRGTATFSDVANAISAEYGFWLGDAFASGGSSGYDHKAMGITARGAWTAVQRHFRELGIEVQTEPITVVGVGDMSGDVFGNGMRQSHAIKLVAAFDHRDIFLDPDPDPARSFKERTRLFDLPGSSWQDYDRALLSPGGGVWPRTVKVIPLARPVRNLLGVEAEALCPPEVIQAILGARVDLLFFGGIGTFVKASGEHADVGDRANDAIRIDATQVRARVIGEGANLGITQRGRIEYARKGGRCNTDSVDNSAGVDISDREVNLKVLLAAAVDANAMDPNERDELLRRMTDDVGDAACRDVYLQTWAISQEVAFSPGGMGAYEQLMADLVAAGRLDRVVEALPSTAEIQRRRAAGAGLARPEVAVLLGHAKADLVACLLASPLPDQAHLQATLRDYFPPLAVERFGHLLERHRLRRELVATVVANDVCNRMGITWVSRTARELGCHDFEAVCAYWAAREVVAADSLYRAVEDLDERVEPMLQMELEGQVDQLIDTYARTYIRHGEAADIGSCVARDRSAFQELAARSSRRGWRSSRRSLALRYAELGLDPELADRIGALPDLHLVPDVATVAKASTQPVPHVCEVFVRLSDALRLDLLRDRLAHVTPDSQWERWQHRGLLDELGELRRTAAAHAIVEHPDATPDEVVARFLASRSAPRERVATLVRLLDHADDATLLHAVAVVVRAFRDVV